MSEIHKFEQAGLGLAPFKFIGFEERRGPISTVINGVRVDIGSPGQPMGTCAYCANGIANCYQVRSADGKTFIVGSECIMKVGDKGLTDPVKRAANKVKTDARRNKLAAQALEAQATYQERVRPLLISKPHSNSYFASQGKTMADYWDYVLKGCGNASYIKHVNRLAKELL